MIIDYRAEELLSACGSEHDGLGADETEPLISRDFCYCVEKCAAPSAQTGATAEGQIIDETRVLGVECAGETSKPTVQRKRDKVGQRRRCWCALRQVRSGQQLTEPPMAREVVRDRDCLPDRARYHGRAQSGDRVRDGLGVTRCAQHAVYARSGYRRKERFQVCANHTE